MIAVNDLNYNKSVMESEKPFILYFQSKTCPHCITVKQILNRIENDKEKPFDFNIFSIQAEESPKLLQAYNVRGFPSTFFFNKEKNITGSIIGSNNLENFVEEVLKISKEQRKSSFFVKIKNLFKE